eukprot:TRINITY_DN7764_c0_g1_i5.p1 TRINITY_DN7764_c0_g1~~TRINITY_DN7764_c0_g1_i5.p1  ORF type:complete len:350 (+),score=60.56 TRINITY_DN7764_c0_g1_i5:110-1051(+)
MSDFPEYAYICLKRPKNSSTVHNTVTYYNYLVFTSDSSRVSVDVSVVPSPFFTDRDCILLDINVDRSNSTWAATNSVSMEFTALFSMGPNIADGAFQLHLASRVDSVPVESVHFFYGSADLFTSSVQGTVASVVKNNYKFLNSPETTNWTAQVAPVKIDYSFMNGDAYKTYENSQFDGKCADNVKVSVCSNLTYGNVSTNSGCSLQGETCFMQLYMLIIRDNSLTTNYTEVSRLSVGLMITTIGSWHGYLVAIFTIIFVVHPATDVVRVSRIKASSVDVDLMSTTEKVKFFETLAKAQKANHSKLIAPPRVEG